MVVARSYIGFVKFSNIYSSQIDETRWQAAVKVTKFEILDGKVQFLSPLISTRRRTAVMHPLG